MFARPSSGGVNRNPGRRPIPTRLPLSESSRALFRQLIRIRGSDPRGAAYVIEIREGPAMNGNTNAAVGKSIPQPWVTVRDFSHPKNAASVPVSVCESLLQHLLTCTGTNEVSPHSDSSEDNDECNSHNTESLAEASGDIKPREDNEVILHDKPSTKINDILVDRRHFSLSQLKPIRIVCEATGCTLEVTAKDPTAKQRSSDKQEKVVQPSDPSRRWLVSAPNVSDHIPEEAHNGGGRAYQQPWETCGFIELHEILLSQLCAFLSDVVTRYRNLHQLPEVRSLYSASGGRRFFFDIRDTRWGKRLHISQVTDLHRNVIGVPLETLVGFRDRLNVIIQRLSLEDQHILRSEIYAPTNTARGESRRRAATETFPRGESRDEPVASLDTASGNPRKATSVPGVNRNSMGNRQRGRSRRYPRAGTFSGVGAPPRPSDGEQNGERVGSLGGPEETSGNGQRVNGSGAGARNNRFLRRHTNRGSGYPARGARRPLSGRPAKGSADTEEECQEDKELPSTTVVSEGEPETPKDAAPVDPRGPVKLVETIQVAPVAEASA